MTCCAAAVAPVVEVPSDAASAEDVAADLHSSADDTLPPTSGVPAHLLEMVRAGGSLKSAAGGPVCPPRALFDFEVHV